MSGQSIGRFSQLSRSIALIGVLLGVFLLTGAQVFGVVGTVLILVATALVAIWGSRRFRHVPANAVELSPSEAPGLFRIVAWLVQQAGLSRTPTLYVTRSGMMNAAAFGTEDAPGLLVTAGLVRGLDRRELAGVLAHEISHIRNRDLLLFRLADTVRYLTTFISRVFWLMVLLYFPLLLATDTLISGWVLLLLLGAPVISLVVQLALLRQREFDADRTAAELTGDPEGLARALYRIDRASRYWVHQFLPLPDRQESSLFRTHPATGERVRRLRELGRELGGEGRRHLRG